MPKRTSLSPALLIENAVSQLRREHPQHLTEIEAFLNPYRMQNGRLQNDDSILGGLEKLKSSWKRRRPTTQRGTKTRK